MRALTNYINDEIINGATISEAIKIGASTDHISVYTCCPKNKEELEAIIQERIKKEGPNCDLNDIDVSNITDMSSLFYMSDFNGDISKWDVSNVENMPWMFFQSKFNGDISKWDVSNVKNMNYMFAYADFNQDISNWKINNPRNTVHIFWSCDIKDEFKPEILKE